MKKLVFTFLIVFGCLLAASQINATNFTQLISSDYQQISSGGGGNGAFAQWFGTSLGNNTFSDIYLKVYSSDEISSYLYARISLCTATTTSPQDCYNNRLSYADFSTQNLNIGVQTYHGTSTGIDVSNKGVLLEFLFSGQNMTTRGYGSVADVFSNSYALYKQNGTTFTTSTAVLDYYFELYSGGVSCSHWTDFANCIWEGNPVYPTGSYGTGNCTWFGDPNGEGFCKDVASAQGIRFGTDETTLFSETPVECVANEFPSSNATMTIPVSMNFYNPPVCTGELQVCQPENITYNNVTINFYDSYNNATSFVLISSVAPGEGKSYAGNLIIPSGTYRVEYNATGTNTLGMTFPFTAPNCLTTVSTTTISTSTEMNYWGTINYLECTNAYDNCIASSTSFIERATCGIQGAFWSLFCPNPLSLAKAKAITNETQKRFPITLVKVFTSAFSSYATSDLATSSATTTYVQADISGFYALGNIGFFADFRSILTAIGFIMIGIFALRFTFEHFFTSK